MVKPPTLILLLSYGIFFAAWDAQAATALSLNGLRADLHARVDDDPRVLDRGADMASTDNSAASSARGFARQAAHSIAQSLRSLFQRNLFGSPTVSQTVGASVPQDHSGLLTSWAESGLHLQEPGWPAQPPLLASLSARNETSLPSFLLTASSALRFQHRLRIA
jgi:hypothetical protein